MIVADDTRKPAPSQRFSVAPMMDYTNRHYRYFARLLSRHSLLYTEMVTAAALLHGDVARHLDYDAAEHPLALQVGGSEPEALANAARLAEQWGYDEINLNVGCPSNRVQAGRFGACLMAEPERVAACITAMREACRIAVTVKTRIGIDADAGDTRLRPFVERVVATGCNTVIVHARNAWLEGLSPKQNRTVPPLRYDLVHALKQQFPALTIAVNGGLKTLEDIEAQLVHVDGVMVGREAYSQPYLLASIDQRLFGVQSEAPSRIQVLEQYLPYMNAQRAHGVSLATLLRPLMGLYQGCAGARRWRRQLSDMIARGDVDMNAIRTAGLAMRQAA